MSRDAVGAKTKLAIAEQTTYETPASSVTTGIEITSESLSSEIGSLVSKALRADRAVHKRIRGNVSASGDINWEQNAEGLTLLYKHALGHGITLPETDGGIRGQLAQDTTANATSLPLVNVVGSDTWVAKKGGGREVVVVFNLANGDLTSAKVAYSDFNPSTNTLTVSSGLPALSKGDFVFLRDSTAYTGIYTHYLEAYKELPTALTVEVHRDIAVFVYSGCRVNTLSENYPTSEMLTGSCNLLARKEWSGDWLASSVNIGENTIEVTDASEFPATGTVSIGSEDDLPYSNITGNVITLDTTVAQAHNVNEPVWLSKPSSDYVYTNVDPFSSFEAGLYMDNVAEEVLSVSWTLNNNLYADKFQIGSRYRVRAPEQNRTVEGTLNVEFDDMNFYSRFVRGTSARLEIRAVKDLEEIVSGSEVYYQKHVIFPKIEFNGSTPTAGGPELITHDLPFTALYDDDYNKPEVIVIFVNGQSSI